MTTKRELIEPNPGDKRYVRRDDKGRFDESVDVGKSLISGRATAFRDGGQARARRPRRPTQFRLTVGTSSTDGGRLSSQDRHIVLDEDDRRVEVDVRKPAELIMNSVG